MKPNERTYTVHGRRGPLTVSTQRVAVNAHQAIRYAQVELFERAGSDEAALWAEVHEPSQEYQDGFDDATTAIYSAVASRHLYKVPQPTKEVLEDWLVQKWEDGRNGYPYG